MPETENGWAAELIGSMRDLLEKAFDLRTLKLILLAAIAITLAMLDPGRAVHANIYLGHVGISDVVTWTFVIIGSLLTIGAISSGLLELRTGRVVANRPDSEITVSDASTRVLGAKVVIGLDVGRTSLSYGAVQFFHADPERSPTLLRDVRFRELVSTKSRKVEAGQDRRQLYNEMVHAVIETIDAVQRSSPQIVISGISVTTPSWIDIAAKSLASPIGPLPVNEQIAENLARYLWERHPEKIRLTFSSADDVVDSQQALFARIFLDEDSRSAARYDLHQRILAGRCWQNYACIIILEGIGAGLILGGELYYGSHASEGEIGHTIVHLESEFRVPSAPGARINIERCACQLPGIHWESIAGTTGLRLLGEGIGLSRYAQLTESYGRPLSEHDLVDAARFVSGAGDDPMGLPAAVRKLLADDKGRFMSYFDMLFKEYARMVTIGVANMANVLDLEHVVIGGTLIKDLYPLNFRNYVRGFWNDYVLRGQVVSHSYKSLKQIWQGSTLLFWDPAYYRQCTGSTLNEYVQKLED